MGQQYRPFPPLPIPPSLASMLDDLSYWAALAALEWQGGLGADEAIMDLPMDRFDLPAPVVVPKMPAVAAKVATAAPVATSRRFARFFAFMVWRRCSFYSHPWFGFREHLVSNGDVLDRLTDVFLNFG